MDESLRLRLPVAGDRVAELDPVQAAAVAWPRDAGHLLVVGAPGTGKSTTATRTVLRRAPAEDGGVLLLVPTRRGAARARDAVAAGLAATTSEVLVRTPASFAYSVLRMRAALLREPPPALITGPEQDQVLADLLAGHEEGLGAQVRWPGSIPPESLRLRAFRDELRDLLMRAAELGLDAAALAERGRRFGRPEWEAAAAVLREYQQVTALGETTPDRGARLDAARIVDEATAALAAWESEVPGHPRPRWRTVVVDDYQDCTLATARLLRVLAADGAQLVLLGDPDAGVQGFRGGEASLVGAATTDDPLGGFGASQLVLPHVHRGHAGLRAVTAAVTQRISTAGVAEHRRATATRPAPAGGAPAGLEITVTRSRAQEGQLVARRLREEHLYHRTPWSQMAVIVRSSADVGAMRRALRTWRVPVGGAGTPGVLREEPAVRPFLTALAAVLAGGPDGEQAAELLASPVGRMDAVSLRALRRTLRARERAADGTRGGDELLAAVVTDPEAADALPAGLRGAPRRVAAVLSAGAEAAARADATAETVLWALWQAADLARPWRERALGGGPGADRADADLDAVMALFRAAEQSTERDLGAGARGFLDHVLAQDLPADTLARQAARAETVQVLTPAAAAGEEWEVVVAAGLQEDAWPDLRLRDSVLGAGALADVEAGRSHDGRRAWGPARREVLDDELRMFTVAVSRATRRLLLTAVLDEEERPSLLVDLLEPLADAASETSGAAVPGALDLRGLVAELRAALEDDDAPAARRDVAATLLAELAAAGVPGADHAAWAGLHAVSTETPLRPDGATVAVSPSAVERATTCPLRWTLEQAGGRRSDSLDQSLGTLVHEIAAALPHGSHAEMQAMLEARWAELELGTGWVATRQRQRAERMIERLAHYVEGVPGDVDVERDFDVEVGRARVRGRMDRVEHTDDGAVRVVDLKTSASAVSKEEARRHPQLGTYQLAVEAGAFGETVRPEGGRLVYLGTGKHETQRPQAPLGRDDEPGWAHDLVTAAAEIMAGSTFLAQLNPSCTHCPVRTSCPLQATGGRVAR